MPSQASGVLNDQERHPLEAASRLAEIPITLRGLPEEFGVSHQSARRHFFSVARGSKVGGAGAHRPSSRPNDLPEW